MNNNRLRTTLFTRWGVAVIVAGSLLACGDQSSKVEEHATRGARDAAIDATPRPEGGWWCFRFVIGATRSETSACLRLEVQCYEGINRLTSGKYDSVIGGAEITSRCAHAVEAWQKNVAGPQPNELVFDSKADCEADLMPGTCKVVR